MQKTQHSQGWVDLGFNGYLVLGIGREHCMYHGHGLL